MDTISLIPALVLNVRKTILGGREFVVGDAVILREGVLTGSKGPLFYPAEEIRQHLHTRVWNGIPVTANHPIGDSARTPGMWDKFHIGHFFNDDYSPETKNRFGEVWIDIELANRVDNRIIPKMMSGEPINVSTGVYTTDIPAPPTANYRGKTYSYTARNYQPDHLAILLDNKGACSVEDGCGLNLEQLRAAHSTVISLNKEWPQEKRDKLDPVDFAGPHKSFPIQTQTDVDAAVKLVGHAEDPSAVRQKITDIAKRKGLSLPDSWTTNQGQWVNAPEKCVHCGAMHETDTHTGICNRCGKQNPKTSTTENSMNCPKCGAPMKDGKCTKCDYVAKNSRTEKVTWLTTNCECWKGKDAVLNDEKSFTEVELDALKTNQERSTLALNTLQQISTTIKAPADTKIGDLPKLVENAATPKKDDTTKTPPPPTDTPVMNKEQLGTEIKSFFAGLTLKDRLTLIGDPTLNEAVDQMKVLVADKRSQVINQLTGHIQDEPTRNEMVKKLEGEKTETLNLMLQLHNKDAATDGTQLATNVGDLPLQSFFGLGKTVTTPPVGTEPTQNKRPGGVSRDNVLLPSLNAFEDEDE